MALTMNASIGGTPSSSAPTAAGGVNSHDGRGFHPLSTGLSFKFKPQLPCSTPLSLSTRTSHVVGASNRFSSRSGKKERRNPSSATTTTSMDDEQIVKGSRGRLMEERGSEVQEDIGIGVKSFDEGYVMPDLPGREPDFWEGSKWDALGFFVQYMWAFGIVFALVACGIAVATYNDGATDFKNTPAYKESIQSKELLEEPEVSDSDVFEANPTEEAPSLE